MHVYPYILEVLKVQRIKIKTQKTESQLTIQLKNMLRYFKFWNNIVFRSRFLFLQNVLFISFSMNITTASNTISDVNYPQKIALKQECN